MPTTQVDINDTFMGGTTPANDYWIWPIDFYT